MAEELCSACGSRVPEGAAFCTTCGAPVQREAADELTAPPGDAAPAEYAPPAGYTPPAGDTPPGYTSYAPPPGYTPPQAPPGSNPPPGYTGPPGYVPPQAPPGYTPPPVAPGYGQGPYGYAGWKPYAGFWRRFAALILDGIIISIATSVFTYGIIGGIFRVGGGGREVAYDLFRLAATWLYFTFMEASSNQATVGKMALGIIVTDLNGQRITWGRANARFWSKIISYVTLLIGFIMAGFTQKKQGLHDMIAGTLVVRKNY